MSLYQDAPVEHIETLDNNTILLEWQSTAAKASELTKREMQLRRLAFERCFPGAKEGSNDLDLSGGWKLKADYPFNYKIVKQEPDSKALENILAQINHPGLVRFEPKISVTQYRLLSSDGMRLFQPYMTITPGTPNLKLLAPGSEGNKRG